MQRRVRDLPQPGLSQQRRVAIFLLTLTGNLLCFGLTAEAKSDYDIINTGIKGGGCWVDDNRFVVEKRVSRQGSQGSELEGLYVLDPLHPADLKPISLAPLEPSAQKRVWQVACQDGNITFLIPVSKKGSSRLYRLRIGEAPELIVEMRAPRVNLQGKYVLGNSHRAVMDGGPLQGAFEGNDDCLLADAKAGFKVLCWDWWLVVPEALPQYVFSQYLWQESIKIKDLYGQAKQVLNPEPPLKLPDGTELKQGYLLRDLDNQIIQEIPTKRGLYRIGGIKPNPGGRYLYATCSKAGDYNPPKTFYGRMCRLTLDGTQAQWEEVFSLQQEANEWASLHDFDVNDAGDVVVMRRAKRSSPTIWRYDVQRARVEQLPTGQLSQEIGGVGLTPDGNSISYIDKDQLIFVRLRKGTP